MAKYGLTALAFENFAKKFPHCIEEHGMKVYKLLKYQLIIFKFLPMVKCH